MRGFTSSLVAALLLAGAANSLAQECIGTGASVSLVNGNPPQPVDKATAFDKDGVSQHFNSILPFEDYRSNTDSTFSCVDSRGEFHALGTPGGDMAELAAGITIFLKQTGLPFSVERVQGIFNAFMAAVATKDRPFYFHTSDEKLRKVFKAVEDAGVQPKPTVFPDQMPQNDTEKEIWLTALTTGGLQGCGHVRLLIEKYADFGLADTNVIQALIRSFFVYWWPTPVRSDARAKSRMTIVQGPLSGEAVAIIDTDGACPGKTAAVPPSHGGSQLFIYHPKAVDDFRLKVLTPFFVSQATKQGKTIEGPAFYNALKSLQAKQLAAVLELLPPANALPVWAVTIKTQAGDPALTAPLNTRAKPQNLANPAYAPKSGNPAPPKASGDAAAAAPKPAAAAAATKPEPATAAAATKPEPATAAAATKPEPATAAAATKPEPATAAAATKPEPATAAAATKPEPAPAAKSG